MINWLIGGIVLLALIFAARHVVRSSKAGGCQGCPGGCSGCACTKAASPERQPSNAS